MDTFDEMIEKLRLFIGKNITLKMFRLESGCRGNLDEGEHWVIFTEERYLLEMIFEGCYRVDSRWNPSGLPSYKLIQFFTGFDIDDNSKKVVAPLRLEENTVGWTRETRDSGREPLDERFYKNFPSRKKILHREEYKGRKSKGIFVLHYSDNVISIGAENQGVKIPIAEIDPTIGWGPLGPDGTPTNQRIYVHHYYSCFTSNPDFGFNEQGVLYHHGGLGQPHYLFKRIL